MAIKALTLGISHEQDSVLFGLNEDPVSRRLKRFDERGIDGITEGHRSGRPQKIKPEQSREYRELILHPEYAGEAHWTGRKFHGYLTEQCQLEAGYSTLMRWIQ